MSVRLSVGVKYSGLIDSLGLGALTARKAYEAVRHVSHQKGFEYADVIPIVDGEPLLESWFRVMRGDNVVEKFAGYHNVAA